MVRDSTQAQEGTQQGYGNIELDAIAKGVEARLQRTLFRNLVIDQTACIARKMRIPEEEINQWRSFRRIVEKLDDI